MFFVNEDGGLTTTGYMLAAIAIFALLILISVLANSNKKIGARQLAFAAVALALASVCSNIKLIHMPMGGSITLLSMLFVTLIGYWYGPFVGLIAAVAYGLIQLCLGAYIISLPQMLVDYIFAFGALGLSGFFSNRKNGLVIGYIVAVIGRFIFSLLSGIIFFATYAPEGTSPFIYSAAYNGGYLFGECIITVIILMVPAVRNAMARVKTQAKA